MLIIRLSSQEKKSTTTPVHVLPIQAWYTRSRNFSPDPQYRYDPSHPVTLSPLHSGSRGLRLPGER